MNQVNLYQQLAWQLDLLPAAEQQSVRKRLEQSESDQARAAAVARALGEAVPPAPAADDVAETIWQQGMQRSAGVIPLPRRRSLRPWIASLAAAAMLAVVFFSGILQQLWSPPDRAIRFTVTGKAARIAGEERSIAAGRILILEAGRTLLAPQGGSLQASLAGGKLRLGENSRLTLLHSRLKAERIAQEWRLDRGTLQADLDPARYARFHVRTPHVLIKAIATKFTVTVASNRTTVHITRGKVRLEPTATNQQPRVLQAGREAIITPLRLRIRALDKQGRAVSPRRTAARKMPDARLRQGRRGPVYNERIYLKNGMVISGNILSQNRSQVVVKSRAGVLRIQRSRIKGIQYLR